MARGSVRGVGAANAITAVQSTSQTETQSTLSLPPLPPPLNAVHTYLHRTYCFCCIAPAEQQYGVHAGARGAAPAGPVGAAGGGHGSVLVGLASGVRTLSPQCTAVWGNGSAACPPPLPAGPLTYPPAPSPAAPSP